MHAANSMLISVGDVLLAVDPGDGRRATACDGRRSSDGNSCRRCSWEGFWVDVSRWKSKQAARLVIGTPGTCVGLRMRRGDGTGACQMGRVRVRVRVGVSASVRVSQGQSISLWESLCS